MATKPLEATTPVVPLLAHSDWQMSFGERAALEGFLSELRPSLAIEIGTAEGGSLERIATHSDEVHSFDLVPPRPEYRELENVSYHTGDSHALLPKLLSRLEEEGRNVDFVLVDGDHSSDGVRSDVEVLLQSSALKRSIVILHDTMNETVREGVEGVRYDAYPKVVYVELDLVAGYLFRDPELRNELWGGLGLVVIDATATRYGTDSAFQDRYYAHFDLMRVMRDLVVSRGDGSALAREELPAPLEELMEARKELERAHRWLDDIQSSPSWRLTAPLRVAKRLLARREPLDRGCS